MFSSKMITMFTGTKKKQSTKLLRRPRIPQNQLHICSHKELHTFSRNFKGKNVFVDIFDIFYLKSDHDCTHLTSPNDSIHNLSNSVSTPSIDESSVFSHSSNAQSKVSKLHKQYVLDPAKQNETNIDDHCLGITKTHRGPDLFPARIHRHNHITLLHDTCAERCSSNPEFTLEHFMLTVAEKRQMPLTELQKIVYSKNNVQKLTMMLAVEMIYPPTQKKVNTITFNPEGLVIVVCYLLIWLLNFIFILVIQIHTYIQFVAVY